MKKPAPQFLAEIRNGSIEISAKVAFKAYLQRFINKRVFLIIKPVTKIRTINQNAYYWGGVLTPISEHTGDSIEVLHELFKDMFIARQEVTWRGIRKKIPATTKTKDMVEFSEYVDKIIVEASQMGIIILSPEEYYQQFSVKIK